MRLDGRLPPGRRGEENGTLATGVSASAGEDDLDGGFVVAAAWDTMLCMDDRAWMRSMSFTRCCVNPVRFHNSRRPERLVRVPGSVVRFTTYASGHGNCCRPAKAASRAHPAHSQAGRDTMRQQERTLPKGLGRTTRTSCTELFASSKLAGLRGLLCSAPASSSPWCVGALPSKLHNGGC